MTGEGNRLEPTEAERQLRAKVHKHMGMTAAILGVAAAGVGFWWISRVFGVSPLAALGEALPLFTIVLAILGAGVLLSLAVSRLAWWVERASKRNRKHEVGE